jgi:hypothetical protein
MRYCNIIQNSYLKQQTRKNYHCGETLSQRQNGDLERGAKTPKRRKKGHPVHPALKLLPRDPVWCKII